MIWRRFHMCAWVTLCCVAAVSECVAPQQAAEGSTDPADDPTGVGPSQKKPDEMPPCPPAPSMPDEGPEPLGSNEMVVVPICDQGVQCYGPSIADEPSTSTAHPGTEISAVQQAPESNEEIRQASDPVPSGLRLGPPQASAKDIPPAWFKLKNNPLVDPDLFQRFIDRGENNRWLVRVVTENNANGFRFIFHEATFQKGGMPPIPSLPADVRGAIMAKQRPWGAYMVLTPKMITAISLEMTQDKTNLMKSPKGRDPFPPDTSRRRFRAMYASDIWLRCAIFNEALQWWNVRSPILRPPIYQPLRLPSEAIGAKFLFHDFFNDVDSNVYGTDHRVGWLREKYLEGFAFPKVLFETLTRNEAIALLSLLRSKEPQYLAQINTLTSYLDGQVHAWRHVADEKLRPPRGFKGPELFQKKAVSYHQRAIAELNAVINNPRIPFTPEKAAMSYERFVRIRNAVDGQGDRRQDQKLRFWDTRQS